MHASYVLYHIAYISVQRIDILVCVTYANIQIKAYITVEEKCVFVKKKLTDDWIKKQNNILTFCFIATYFLLK